MTFERSGIYEILNTVNGKRYIGSAMKLKTRRLRHWRELKRGVHTNPHLQAAWNKYGEQAFRFLPILTCAPTKQMLMFYEQQLLDKVLPEYNIAVKADSPMYGRVHTPAVRSHLSTVRIGKKNALGFKHSLATREKMSRSQKGNKNALGTKATAETRAKISIAMTGKKQSVATRLKRSISMTGLKRKPTPVSVRTKISESLLRYYQGIMA